MHGNIYKLCAGDGMLLCDRTERQCQGYPGPETEAEVGALAMTTHPATGNKQPASNNKPANRQNNNNDIALVYLQDGQPQTWVWIDGWRHCYIQHRVHRCLGTRQHVPCHPTPPCWGVTKTGTTLNEYTEGK